MSKNLYILVGVLGLLCLPLAVYAQQTYTMANSSVTDCDGVLTDSDGGQIPGTYDHNENLTFRICIPQAEKITLQFISFCTEEQFDYLRIFDGPDTLSTLIGGPYSGVLPPFSVTATSGCMTINFISDANVVCTGWVAVWNTEVAKPVPPVIAPLGNVPCFSEELILNLSTPVLCDSVTAASFTVFGAKTYGVASAQPLNCSGGFTTQVRVTLGSPIDFSGNYTVRFRGTQLDECGRPHPFNVETTFAVTDCPLSVTLNIQPEAFCAGHCTQVTATASGGDPTSYSYQWSVPGGNTATIEVCPTMPLTVFVTVTDGAGSVPAVGSLLVTPLEKPVLPPDTTLCQSNPAFWIPHTLPGGEWYGRGINPNRRWENRWDAWRLGNHLVDEVIYIAPNGCSDTMIIHKIPINQGGQDAACPGAPIFKVKGGTPAGGEWSGPFITPDGFFDPSTPGTYWVTYTHPNGCSGSKQVNVAELVMPPDDTVCTSRSPWNLPVTPFGGSWSGSGIVNAGNGRFDPMAANVGDNILTYTAQGCTGTVNIHVREINASWDMVACPDGGPFLLPGDWTPGGLWSGAGIIDPVTGLYDPAIMGHGADETLTLTFDDCSDTRIIYIRSTRIYLDDTLRYCVEADSFELNWDNVRRDPGNGIWTGAGTFENPDHEWRWYFSPGLAGPGLHKLVYTANGCTDSTWIRVYEVPEVRPDTVCSLADPYLLSASTPVATWQGPGIINTATGLFDPVQAGQGAHYISIVSNAGCIGGGFVTVQDPDTVTLAGLEPVYCFRDTQIAIVALPAGGILTMNGQAIGGVFNPAIAGQGVHTIRYRIGSGECADEKTRFVQVGAPVTVATAFDSDTICFARGRQISAQGNGGSTFGNFSYTWNQGIGFGQTHLVTPESTTSYAVTVSDGCSDPAVGVLEIVVRPQITVSFTTGPPVCYGIETFAIATASPAGSYAYTWLTNPPRYGPEMQALSGVYRLEVVETQTGCRTEDEVRLPGYKPIQANFSISPQGECVTIADPYVEILDFSNGGETGTWSFGDGFAMSYQPGADVSHTYRDTGMYLVTLSIKNEGGCVSRFEQEVCVEAITTLFIPNAFTANADGRNDFFQMKGIGVVDIQWQIFDRWGTLLFEGHSLDDRWDGTWRGRPMPQGVYVYKIRYRTVYQEDYQDTAGSVMLLR
jgi:gliding motility-associated-like protein